MCMCMCNVRVCVCVCVCVGVCVSSCACVSTHTSDVCIYLGIYIPAHCKCCSELCERVTGTVCSLIATMWAHPGALYETDPSSWVAEWVVLSLLHLLPLSLYTHSSPDPYCILSLGSKSTRSITMRQTVTPRWEETLVLDLGIYGDPQHLLLSPPTVTMEFYDSDTVVSYVDGAMI